MSWWPTEIFETQNWPCWSWCGAISQSCKLAKFTCQMETDLLHHIPDPPSIWKPPSRTGPWMSPTPKAKLASNEKKSALSSARMSTDQPVLLILYRCPLKQKIPGGKSLKMVSVTPFFILETRNLGPGAAVSRVCSISWDFRWLAPTPNLFGCCNRISEMGNIFIYLFLGDCIHVYNVSWS